MSIRGRQKQNRQLSSYNYEYDVQDIPSEDARRASVFKEMLSWAGEAKNLDEFIRLLQDWPPRVLEQVRVIFDEITAGYSRGMAEEVFIDEFIPSLNPRQLPRSDVKLWFLRIDTNSDGYISWADLSSQLISLKAAAEVERLKKQQFSHPSDLIGDDEDAIKKDQPQHFDVISSIHVHKAGVYLTTSDDGTVKCWESDTLIHKYTITNNASVISCSLVPPSGKFFITGSIDRVLSVYNINEQIKANGAFVRRFVGTQVVIKSQQRKTKKERKLRQLEDFDQTNLVDWIDAPSSLEFMDLNNRDHLLIGTYNGMVHLYPLHTLTMLNYPLGMQSVWKMKLHEETICKVQWCPYMSKGTIITGSWDKLLKIVDIETNKVVRIMGEVEGHQKSVFSFNWMPSLQLLTSSGLEKDIFIWNPYVNHPVYKFTGHSAPVIALVANEADGQLISLSRDKVVKIWDVRTTKLFQTILDTEIHYPEDILNAITYDSERKCILTASTQLQVYRLRCSSNNKTAVSREAGPVESAPGGHAENIISVLYANRYSYIISVDDQTAFVWEIDTGRKVFNFSLKEGDASDELSKGFSKEKFYGLVTTSTLDGREKKLLCGMSDGNVLMYNYFNGSMMKKLTLDGEPTEVQRMIHMDREAQEIRFIIAATSKSLVRWKDDEARHVAAEKRARKRKVSTVNCICNLMGVLFALGTASGTIYVRSAITGRTLLKLKTTTMPVRGVITGIKVPHRPLRATFEQRECDSSESDKDQKEEHTDGFETSNASSTSDDDDEIDDELASVVGDVRRTRSVESMAYLERLEVLCCVMGDKYLYVWNELDRNGDLVLKYKILATVDEDYYLIVKCGLLTAVADGNGGVVIVDFSKFPAKHARQIITGKGDTRLVTSRYKFKPHSTAITQLNLVQHAGAEYVLSTAQMTNVHLHTLQGEFIGIFGSKEWSLGINSTWQHYAPSLQTQPQEATLGDILNRVMATESANSLPRLSEAPSQSALLPSHYYEKTELGKPAEKNADPTSGLTFPEVRTVTFSPVVKQHVLDPQFMEGEFRPLSVNPPTEGHSAPSSRGIGGYSSPSTTSSDEIVIEKHNANMHEVTKETAFFQKMAEMRRKERKLLRKANRKIQLFQTTPLALLADQITKFQASHRTGQNYETVDTAELYTRAYTRISQLQQEPEEDDDEADDEREEAEPLVYSRVKRALYFRREEEKKSQTGATHSTFTRVLSKGSLGIPADPLRCASPNVATSLHGMVNIRKLTPRKINTLDDEQSAFSSASGFSVSESTPTQSSKYMPYSSSPPTATSLASIPESDFLIPHTVVPVTVANVQSAELNKEILQKTMERMMRTAEKGSRLHRALCVRVSVANATRDTLGRPEKEDDDSVLVKSSVSTLSSTTPTAINVDRARKSSRVWSRRAVSLLPLPAMEKTPKANLKVWTRDNVYELTGSGKVTADNEDADVNIEFTPSVLLGSTGLNVDWGYEDHQLPQLFKESSMDVAQKRVSRTVTLEMAKRHGANERMKIRELKNTLRTSRTDWKRSMRMAEFGALGV